MKKTLVPILILLLLFVGAIVWVGTRDDDQPKIVVHDYVIFEKSIGDFLLDWLDNNDFIVAKTSGSTGAPKTITLKKQAMVNSAIATGNYFNLVSGNKALHCLSTEFIAGKMMLVRAIVLGLEIDLVEPSLNPLQRIFKNYDFCAMVPIQLQNPLQELQKIKILIVGGASVSFSLEEKIHA